MKNVSNNFKNVISKGGPFYAYAKIVLRDGTELELDSTDDFYIDGNSYNESGGDGFPLGVALSKTIDIGIENSNERYSGYDFYYSRITLYTEADLEDGTKERILEGTFTVIDPVSSGDIIEITAADDMYKSDVPYTSKLTYPATTRAILQEACSQSGISLSSAAFENDDFTVQAAPQGLTCRQVIGYVAMIAGGNAVMSEYNQLIIKTYRFPAFDSKKILSGGRFDQDLKDMVSGGDFTQEYDNTISGGEFGENDDYVILSDFSTDPDISTDDVVITGIATTAQGEGKEEDQEFLYGTDDYAIKIENPLIEGKEETAIALIGDLLIGTIARPFSGEFFPDPTVQFMDPVYLVDRKDNIYQSFVTSLTFTYLGNSNISNGLQNPEMNKSTYYSTATEVYRKARQDLQKSKTEWEKAVENLGNRLDNASGLYPTEEKQPDGSTIYYLHDKPTLEESEVVIKITAQAMGISTDGGKTYPVGVTVDGEAVIKILQTIGVNADWINAGAIKVTDNEGNTIFLVDMDTKQILISGDSVQIGGKSATEAINEALEAAQNAGGINLQLDNEFQGISTDYEGNISGSFPECKTTAQVFYGQTDITNNCVFTTTKSASITGSWNNQTKTYTVTGLSADSGWVDITATYLTTISVTKRFGIEKIKGGVPGQDGAQGIPGDPGEDGKTSYFHIKYSAVSNPTSSSQMSETPNAYIGTYVDFTQSDSNDPSDYTWAKFRGDNGADGIPGTNGENGQTSYLHIAYANNSTGTLDFSTTNSTNKTYIGQYVDFIKSDSNSPSKYNWTKIKGDDGQDGQDGQPGRTFFIEPSATILKRTKDNAISPSQISFSAYYRDGDSATRYSYSGRWIIDTTSNGISYTEIYRSSSNESSVSRSLTGISSSVIQIRARLYASGGFTTMIDSQSVTIVNDIDSLTPLEVLELISQGMEGIYSPDGVHYYINASAIKSGQIQGIEIISERGNDWMKMSQSLLTGGYGSTTDGLLDLSANYSGGERHVVLESKTGDVILKSSGDFLVERPGTGQGTLLQSGNYQYLTDVGDVEISSSETEELRAIALGESVARDASNNPIDALALIRKDTLSKVFYEGDYFSYFSSHIITGWRFVSLTTPTTIAPGYTWDLTANASGSGIPYRTGTEYLVIPVSTGWGAVGSIDQPTSAYGQGSTNFTVTLLNNGSSAHTIGCTCLVLGLLSRDLSPLA